MNTQTQLTIYALADNSTLTEDVYTSTSPRRLYIHLTDHRGETLVRTPVTTVKEALSALRDHRCDDVTVSYNTDCTRKIYQLANSINQHLLS